MVDSKTVISQVQDLQLILHDIYTEGMSLSESFQVAALIEKLPQRWKEFKNYLKHKRKKNVFRRIDCAFEDWGGLPQFREAGW